MVGSSCVCELICGVGYDTCFVRSHNGTNSTLAVELYSPASGIKLSISSDQHAIQLYSCDGLDGSIPAKASQGGQDGVVYGQYRFVHYISQPVVRFILKLLR